MTLFGGIEEPFVSAPPYRSVTFSKCVRKGRGFELSGSEAFLGLVMPLVKALKHFVRDEAPPKTAQYHSLHITIPIGVIDAPMVGVTFRGGVPESALVPWVRVFRHESKSPLDSSDRARVFALDFVHKDFLQAYLADHAVPFAQKFAFMCIKHDKVIADLKGFIPGMGKDSWTNLEQRLRRK